MKKGRSVPVTPGKQGTRSQRITVIRFVNVSLIFKGGQGAVLHRHSQKVLRSPGTSRTLVFQVLFQKFVRKLLAQIRQFQVCQVYKGERWGASLWGRFRWKAVEGSIWEFSVGRLRGRRVKVSAGELGLGRLRGKEVKGRRAGELSIGGGVGGDGSERSEINKSEKRNGRKGKRRLSK